MRCLLCLTKIELRYSEKTVNY